MAVWAKGVATKRGGQTVEMLVGLSLSDHPDGQPGSIMALTLAGKCDTPGFYNS